MSRSVLRFVAAAMAVAVIPAVSQAQGNCVVNTTAAPPWGCAVPVQFTAGLTIPTLARLDVVATSLTFPDPTGGWAAFLATPAAEEVVVQTGFGVKTNATHDIVLNYVSFGGAWDNTDVDYGVIADAGTCLNTDTTNDVLGTPNVVVNNASATNGLDRELCIGLNIPGSLASPKLAPGTFTLTLNLTITSP